MGVTLAMPSGRQAPRESSANLHRRHSRTPTVPSERCGFAARHTACDDPLPRLALSVGSWHVAVRLTDGSRFVGTFPIDTLRPTLAPIEVPLVRTN